jgi:hypothetical protein
MNAKRVVLCLVLVVSTLSGFAAGPTTRANDDSCDIALLPAATLLLPFFEVDFTDSANETTLLSVTNVSAVSRVARVTLWTDWAYPVLSFNVYLTGYDTQSISLFDVLAHGIIGSGSGTGIATSPVGEFSDPNPQLDQTSCASLPGRLDASLVARMQIAFTESLIEGCDSVGNVHEHARGYATIDVVGNCSDANPADPEYFTNDIRYDNVLVGDYQQVSVKRKSAQVSPMVHIRAIPEGGTPTSRLDDPERYGNRFANTFYGRFQKGVLNSDARQPLPSQFAVRWINGGPGGFQTALKIWRESSTGFNTGCSGLSNNGRTRVTDNVVFDSEENGEGTPVFTCQIICVGDLFLTLPSTALEYVEPGSELFHHSILSTATSGWAYLNLDDGNVENGSHQGWVVVSMRASNDFSGDMDGTALGNGCSPAAGLAEESENGSVVIGPAADGEP